MSPQVQHLWVFSLTSLFWSLYAPSADHITLVQPGCLSFPDERRQKWRNCQVSSGRLLAVLLSWFNPSLSEWSELRWTNQNLWYDRSSTPWIHTKFSNTCWTGARFCQVVPDVPVTRLWLEVQPGISVLFAFRCGIYVCLMSRFPLCLHVVPQVCAESEACGCEWVTDVHRSSRRVSCFKCFTFYLKDLFKSLTAVSKKLKFREVQLKNIIMSNLLWFSATYNIWWVCLLRFVSYWHFK